MGFSSPPQAKLIAPSVVTEANLDSQGRRLKDRGKDWAAELQPSPPFSGAPTRKGPFQEPGLFCSTAVSCGSPEEPAGWEGWRRGELVPAEGLRAHHGKPTVITVYLSVAVAWACVLGTGPRGEGLAGQSGLGVDLEPQRWSLRPGKFPGFQWEGTLRPSGPLGVKREAFGEPGRAGRRWQPPGLGMGCPE